MTCKDGNHRWVVTKEKDIKGHHYTFYDCLDCEETKMEIDGLEI